MKQEQAELLVECLRRERQLAGFAPPARTSRWWGCWVAETTHGPEYAAGEWFGRPVLPHMRMRYRRGLAALERDGLLVTWRQYGRRLSHVKLTPQGKRVAAKLLAEQVATQEPKA